MPMIHYVGPPMPTPPSVDQQSEMISAWLRPRNQRRTPTLNDGVQLINIEGARGSDPWSAAVLWMVRLSPGKPCVFRVFAIKKSPQKVWLVEPGSDHIRVIPIHGPDNSWRVYELEADAWSAAQSKVREELARIRRDLASRQSWALALDHELKTKPTLEAECAKRLRDGPRPELPVLAVEMSMHSSPREWQDTITEPHVNAEARHHGNPPRE